MPRTTRPPVTVPVTLRVTPAQLRKLHEAAGDSENLSTACRRVLFAWAGVDESPVRPGGRPRKTG